MLGNLTRRVRVALIGTAGAVMALAIGASFLLHPSHPVQGRWRYVNPVGPCGTAPPTSVEFGRDGYMRSYIHFANGPDEGDGQPVPYAVSGNRITLGTPADHWEGEYTISGKSLTVRRLGMEGTEWENHMMRYEAE